MRYSLYGRLKANYAFKFGSVVPISQFIDEEMLYKTMSVLKSYLQVKACQYLTLKLDCVLQQCLC